MVCPLDPGAPDVVDGLLAACGGGQSLHLGPGADTVVAMFRQRALDARVLDHDGQTLLQALRHQPDASVDLACAYHVLDALTRAERAVIFDELLRISRRGVLIATSATSRDDWESACLQHACRKHPLHQLVVSYDGIDWRRGATLLLFEPLASDLVVGRSVKDLAAARDLHMDMLREAGCRADAHVARYMLARQFVRPGDRVLDAACGLGYGSAILTDGTLASRVVGLDVDASAVRYARDHYGRWRSRLAFDTCDLATLGAQPAGSFDVVVSFETIEHITDPEAFVAACRRLLTPAGRLICSVPNAWVDATGRDPNPHHLHVFDRPRLEALCRRHFLMERVYGQTAGNGMKLPDSGRALWVAGADSVDAEWWLAVAMAPPAATASSSFRLGLLDHPEDDITNVLAFERDYANPWLARALVTIGLRAESAELLEAIADDTLSLHARTATAPAADAGAALCVKVYRRIDAHAPLDDDLLARIDAYCTASSAVPHVWRWQISLRYAEAISWLRQARWDRAIPALERCALADAVAFSPLLSTKTVGAALLRGWLAAQARDVEGARHWWTKGLTEAERALHRPWDELLLSRREPALFGLREATLIVDLASRCATGLHMLPHLLDRPGIVLSQLFDSPVERGVRDAARVRDLERQLHDATDEIDRLRHLARATVFLGDPEAALPADLRIAVFGAGSGGRVALQSLRARGGAVTCLTDNDGTRHGSELDGLPVVDPATLPSRDIDVIAVASRPGRAAIFAQLEDMGYRIGRDVAFVGTD